MVREICSSGPPDTIQIDFFALREALKFLKCYANLKDLYNLIKLNLPNHDLGFSDLDWLRVRLEVELSSGFEVCERMSTFPSGTGSTGCKCEHLVNKIVKHF